MSDPGVDELLDSLGRADARPVMDRFCARGEEALEELLDALAGPAVEKEPRADRPPVNGRAYMEDLEETLGRLARAHADAFVPMLQRRLALLDRFVVLSAVASVRRPETTAWLLDALGSRSGHNRWLALGELLCRQAPEVRPRLLALLRDRDSLVRFEAVSGLRRWGTPEAIDALLVFARRAPLGAKWLAEDAVESICERAGVMLPEEHPGRRLVEVPIPDGPEVKVVASSALQRREGEPLAEVDGKVVARSPCDAVVVAIDTDPNGLSRRVVLRQVELARG
jgi:hypothetical protein